MYQNFSRKKFIVIFILFSINFTATCRWHIYTVRSFASKDHLSVTDACTNLVLYTFEEKNETFDTKKETKQNFPHF